MLLLYPRCAPALPLVCPCYVLAMPLLCPCYVLAMSSRGLGFETLPRYLGYSYCVFPRRSLAFIGRAREFVPWVLVSTKRDIWKFWSLLLIRWYISAERWKLKLSSWFSFTSISYQRNENWNYVDWFSLASIWVMLICIQPLITIRNTPITFTHKSLLLFVFSGVIIFDSLISVYEIFDSLISVRAVFWVSFLCMRYFHSLISVPAIFL